MSFCACFPGRLQHSGVCLHAGLLLPSTPPIAKSDSAFVSPMSCPSTRPLIHIHPSNIFPAGRLYPLLFQMSRSTLAVGALGPFFRHMRASPKWCQRCAESSTVQHMLNTQSCFPQMAVPPARMDRNWRDGFTEKLFKHTLFGCVAN